MKKTSTLALIILPFSLAILTFMNRPKTVVIYKEFTPVLSDYEQEKLEREVAITHEKGYTVCNEVYLDIRGSYPIK